MEIRLMGPEDDSLAVGRVYLESWRYAYREILPQAYLDGLSAGRWAGTRPASLLLLDGDRIAGTSAFGPSRFGQWPDWGEIISLYLLPAYMGQGCGAALLRAAIRQLRQMGYEKVFLWVLEENRRARRFYEGQGFVFGGEYRQDCIGGKRVREARYVSEAAGREAGDYPLAAGGGF